MPYTPASLTGTRLRLRYNVPAFGDGHDGSLLDRRWLLKVVGVDAADEILLEVHLVERRRHADFLAALKDQFLVAGVIHWWWLVGEREGRWEVEMR